MKRIFLRDLMVPLKDYATVNQDATLYEALIALEKAQEKFNKNQYTHRAILVYNGDQIVGKIDQIDLIKGLEQGYAHIKEVEKVPYSGYTKFFLKSLAEKHNLWQEPMKDICRKGTKIKVRDIMHTSEEGEYVDIDDTLDEAIHQIVMGRRQSLLVTDENKIVGILRLTDIFSHICEVMKTCEY